MSIVHILNRFTHLVGGNLIHDSKKTNKTQFTKLTLFQVKKYFLTILGMKSEHLEIQAVY